MRLQTSSHLAYEDIGRNQVYLTDEEEQSLVKEYKARMNELYRYILARKQCLQYFINKYREVVASGRSVAKLSADYNPRKAGVNKRIEEQFKLALDKSKNGSITKDVLLKLNLSYDVYAEMAQHLRQSAKLTALRTEISRLENTLFCSMLLSTQELAKKYASNLLGIDEADAGQQVGIYMLDSVRKYDPNYRTPSGYRIKLMTYAYSRAENLLKEWILTNSRLVRVPRSKMERILIIVKAYDALVPDNINLFTLAQESNKILKDRKKLTPKHAFTVEEVDKLLKILMSNYVHLDQPYRRDNRSSVTTIGEMLSKEQASVDEAIEERERKDLMFKLMEDNLEDIEFQVIMLRWFYEDSDKTPTPLTDVGKLLVSEYGGTEYSRESVRLIEKAAITKLREIKEVQSLWLN